MIPFAVAGFPLPCLAGSNRDPAIAMGQLGRRRGRFVPDFSMVRRDKLRPLRQLLAARRLEELIEGLFVSDSDHLA
jgi:hypothetical protein